MPELASAEIRADRGSASEWKGESIGSDTIRDQGADDAALKEMRPCVRIHKALIAPRKAEHSAHRRTAWWRTTCTKRPGSADYLAPWPLAARPRATPFALYHAVIRCASVPPGCTYCISQGVSGPGYFVAYALLPPEPSFLAGWCGQTRSIHR